MFSNDELISAVSAAGRDGKTFTLKDLRTQLGFDSRDKKELSRFRRRLRAFEKSYAEQLEKLGNNSYRLRSGALEQKPEPAPEPASEKDVTLERASGVFESAIPANEPESTRAPALHAVEHNRQHVAAAAQSSSEPISASTPRRVLGVATALMSGAFATTAAVSGKVREHGRNLKEQLWSCIRSAPARQHAFARLRGWAEGLRPLSHEVREQLSALRQRVLPNRRRAA